MCQSLVDPSRESNVSADDHFRLPHIAVANDTTSHSVNRNYSIMLVDRSERPANECMLDWSPWGVAEDLNEFARPEKLKGTPDRVLPRSLIAERATSE